MCQLAAGTTTGSAPCTCNGQYLTSECDIVHNKDNSCTVTSKYLYDGKCNDKPIPPTAAPSVSKTCPEKNCHGQNSELVQKIRGKCNASTLNQFCLKAKLTAKMNADLECNVENKCLCYGKYSHARCFSVPVRSQKPSVLSVFKPYCYYFAKFIYDGMCEIRYTPFRALEKVENKPIESNGLLEIP